MKKGSLWKIKKISTKIQKMELGINNSYYLYDINNLLDKIENQKSNLEITMNNKVISDNKKIEINSYIIKIIYRV